MASRFAGIALAIGMAAAGVVQPALAGPAFDRVASALGTAGCEGVYINGRRLSDVAMALSAWSGRSVETLIGQAGDTRLSMDFLASDEELDARDDEVAEALVAASGAADAIAADLADLGPGMCPILRAMFSDQLQDLVGKQQAFRSFYHPYLIAAQRLTLINGCGPNEADGAFGAASREAWRDFRRQVAPQTASSADIPPPGEVVRLAGIELAAGACDADSPRGEAKAASLEHLWPPEYREPLLARDDYAGTLAFLDRLGREGLWPPYLEWAASEAAGSGSTGEEPFGETSADGIAKLARIYETGFGIEPNPEAAAYWRDMLEPSPFDLYRAGLEDEDKAEEAARALLEDLGVRPVAEAGDETDESSDEETQAAEEDAGPDLEEISNFAGPILIPASGAAVSIEGLDRLTWLARLAQRWPHIRDLLADETSPTLQIAVADRLLDSAGPAGRDAAAAAALLEKAAAAGDLYAQTRLAFLYRHGLGVEKNPARAIQLATRAAERGEPFAMYQLALFQEEAGSVDAAAAGLAAMLDRLAAAPEWGNDEAMTLVANRMLAAPGMMASPAMRGRLEALAGKNVAFAEALARLALCTTCGGVVDEAAAARWLRVALDHNRLSVAPMLYRLLDHAPQLARTPGEGLERLEASTEVESILLLAAVKSGPPGSAERRAGVAKKLDQLCSRVADTSCSEAAAILAEGLIDPSLVAEGFKRLKGEELADALAAYGDFEGSLAEFVAARKAFGRLDLGSFGPEPDKSLRDATLRRVTAALVGGRIAEPPRGLLPLLRFLGQNGDTAAPGYLKAIEGGTGQAGPPAPVGGVESLREAFARQSERGGLSRAYVQAARDLSQVLETDGGRDEALRLELTALSAEMRLDDVMALSEGPLQADLTRVCHLSKASERAFALGAADVSTLIAKDAVNLLQRVRRNLSSLPERLQGCFRDLVSDHYRWLAQRFMEQDRHDEADLVLGMLKDFEAFQFVGKDEDFTRRSYDELPLSEAERGFREQLSALVPPVSADAVRRLELRAQRQSGALSEAETAELAAIEERLRAAEAAYRAALDELVASAGALGGATAVRLEELGQLRSYLRSDVETPAVALHYVVLPDRMGIMLTTRDTRVSRIVRDWQGEPFTEARLDAAIAALHARLGNPGADPRKEAEALYALLVAPLMPEIEAAGAKLVLLSQDRRLRYLPFAALYDGEHYLAERFELTTLSDAGFEVAGSKVTGTPIAALGTTRAVSGFSALPGVGLELDGLVQDDKGYGLMPGRALLDDAFDRTALEDALLIGETAPAKLGIVHVSSHFSLGRTDAASFLLLGTGEQLSLKDIKDDTLAFDFGRVDLLTLSACATGFADVSGDGRELESFAEITRRGGARAIVATLWPVEDKATALFMQRFYELRERAGMSKSQALAMVQREFIANAIGSGADLPGQSIVLETAQRGGIVLGAPPPADRPLGLSHPYYWSPFVLAGNWR